MCMGFIDLNDVCPKDHHPLSNIYRLIDGYLVYKTISFMDAYFGYNQIKMDHMDAPKTTFMSNHGNYYYIDVPFELMNICATYQRLMDTVFSKQIGHNLEAYIDEMIVKTYEGESHTTHKEDIMVSVRDYNMRINPTKCSFGYKLGKLLGFMLTKKGIKENTYKCQAIIDMRSPFNVKNFIN